MAILLMSFDVQSQNLDPDDYDILTETWPLGAVIDPDSLDWGDFGISPNPLHQCLNADIYIVADWSQSMRNSRLDLVKAIAHFAYGIIPVPGKVSIGLVTFGDRCTVQFPLTTDHHEIDLALRRLAKTSPDAPFTCVQNAMQTVLASLMERSNNGRAKIVIVISDGEIGDAGYFDGADPIAMEWAELLKMEGALIYSINVGERKDISAKRVLFEIQNEGYFETNYPSLKTTLENMNFCG